MKKNNQLKLLVASFTLITLTGSFFSSFEADAQTTRPRGRVMNVRDDDASDDGFANEKTFYLFGGIDLGFSSYSASNTTYTLNGVSELDVSRSGFQGGVRGLFAYYQKKWLIDGGLGWQYLKNSGTFADNSKSTVTTRTSYLDISPRYRFDHHWQLGPEVEYWMSTDNGLNANPYNTSISTNGLFGGVQGMYEWMQSDNSNKYRLGARWLTAFNADSRSANVFQAFFEFGFGIFDSGRNDEETDAPRTRVNETVNAGDLDHASDYQSPADPLPLPVATPWPTVAATPEPAPEVAPTPKPRAQEKVVITLDVGKLPFEFNSARMPKYNQDRVKEMGRFLGQHKSTWRTLTVEGHTDERGSTKYNDKLSKARADTVRQLLGEGGAPLKRIKAVGVGKRKPLDRHHNEKAWAKNRRVELLFYGVKDVNILRNNVGN